jgi:hypothetical protein
MINKFDLLRSLLFAALLCMLIWGAFFWLTNQAHHIPEAYKEVLLTGFLLWLISVFLNANKDDDWAGEF